MVAETCKYALDLECSSDSHVWKVIQSWRRCSPEWINSQVRSWVCCEETGFGRKGLVTEGVAWKSASPSAPPLALCSLGILR